MVTVVITRFNVSLSIKIIPVFQIKAPPKGKQTLHNCTSGTTGHEKIWLLPV